MGAGEEYAASIDATLIHRGAFTEQLNLVGADASVEQLALTDDDVQFLGITVDESESKNTSSVEDFSNTTNSGGEKHHLGNNCELHRLCNTFESSALSRGADKFVPSEW